MRYCRILENSKSSTRTLHATSQAVKLIRINVVKIIKTEAFQSMTPLWVMLVICEIWWRVFLLYFQDGGGDRTSAWWGCNIWFQSIFIHNYIAKIQNTYLREALKKHPEGVINFFGVGYFYIFLFIFVCKLQKIWVSGFRRNAPYAQSWVFFQNI